MTTHSHCAWTNEGGHVKLFKLAVASDGYRLVQTESVANLG